MKQRTRKVWPNTVEVALGDALEWGIQRWVVWTGRETRISEAPWLEGPIGERRIGPDFYEAYAREEALELVEGEPETGLLMDFSVLSGGGFEAGMERSPAILRPDAYIPCQPQHTAAQPADLAGRGGRRDE